VGGCGQAVADGDIRIVPERFEKVYNMWLGGIRDWCVSRQLWWGHRIPHPPPRAWLQKSFGRVSVCMWAGRGRELF